MSLTLPLPCFLFLFFSSPSFESKERVKKWEMRTGIKKNCIMNAVTLKNDKCHINGTVDVLNYILWCHNSTCYAYYDIMDAMNIYIMNLSPLGTHGDPNSYFLLICNPHVEVKINFFIVQPREPRMTLSQWHLTALFIWHVYWWAFMFDVGIISASFIA